MTAKPFVLATPAFALILWLMPWPDLKPGFWPLMALTVPLTSIAIFFNLNAFRTSPISLTMPLLSFTPIFTAATAFLFLGETLSLLGMSGILLIIAGSYIINIAHRKTGILGPFKAIILENGSRSMLTAAILYGFCSVLGKMVIHRSSPIFTGASIFLGIGLIVVFVPLLSGRASAKALVSRPGPTALVNAFVVAEVLCHNTAIALVNAAYMIAIKRLNGLFGVLFGWLFFKETNIRSRFVGALLMSMGAALIVLFR